MAKRKLEWNFGSQPNLYVYGIALLGALAGLGLSLAWLCGSSRILLGVILAFLFAGCIVFSIQYILSGLRSKGFLAFGFGAAATVIPLILYFGNAQNSKCILLSVCAVLTVFATVWALNGNKRKRQRPDSIATRSFRLGNKASRIPMAVLYLLSAAGIVLALLAVIRPQ